MLTLVSHKSVSSYECMGGTRLAQRYWQKNQWGKIGKGSFSDCWTMPAPKHKKNTALPLWNLNKYLENKGNNLQIEERKTAKIRCNVQY